MGLVKIYIYDGIIRIEQTRDWFTKAIIVLPEQVDELIEQLTKAKEEPSKEVKS